MLFPGMKQILADAVVNIMNHLYLFFYENEATSQLLFFLKKSIRNVLPYFFASERNARLLLQEEEEEEKSRNIHSPRFILNHLSF